MGLRYCLCGDDDCPRCHGSPIQYEPDDLVFPDEPGALEPMHRTDDFRP
jgi:hypothetical protein